ncbi:MAG: outer membrane beta-barrel protein [Bacteroidales bacterium]|nr:outer membrane beta-barrel protein [Bacteroidales bacterium]
MQNEHTEFDLLVRSMMQEAEENVSPRAWDAVSAGLDARARRTVVLRWRRVAAGIAAAAAVTVGAFLLGTRNNSNLPIIETVAETVATPESELPSDEIIPAAEPQDLLADARTQAKPIVKARPADTPKAAETVPQAVGEPVEPVSEEVPSPSVPQDVIPETVPEAFPETQEKTALQEEETWDDPFARMEWEDAREASSSRISLSAGATLESNGNPASISGFRGMRAAANTEREHTVIEQTSRNSTYAIPISAGLGVRIGLGERWAVGTGVNWTLLQRTFTGIFREEGKAPVNADIHNTLQYVGIPLNLSYTLLDNKRIGLYTFAGGTVEKAISNKFRVHDSAERLFHKESVDGVQFSAAAGLGVQFQLTDFLGLYIDPSVRYYFKGNQPQSIRTQQPLMMNFEIGLRWDL